MVFRKNISFITTIVKFLQDNIQSLFEISNWYGCQTQMAPFKRKKGFWNVFKDYFHNVEFCSSNLPKFNVYLAELSSKT